MNPSILPPGSRSSAADAPPDLQEAARAPGISWGAVLAGAAGAASLALILLMLGLGLGLSSVSPWSYAGVSAETFGVGTILWLTFTQLAASGLGGYLAGRLRQRWSRVHTDEVYFRDTAHGFLAWSVGTLATAGLLTATIGTLLGEGVRAGATAAGVTAVAGAPAAPGALTAAGAAGVSPDTFVDALFRPGESGAAASAPAPASATCGPLAPQPAAPLLRTPPEPPPTAEVVRLFAMTAADAGRAPPAAGPTGLPPEDARYLAQLVAQRTGLSSQEAESRVTRTFARFQAKVTSAKEQARQAAEKARSAAAKAALWSFISLLIGAFVASWLGTMGGRHRDRF